MSRAVALNRHRVSSNKHLKGPLIPKSKKKKKYNEHLKQNSKDFKRKVPKNKAVFIY